MDNVTVSQAADFLSIALECIESRDEEMAQDFVNDVAGMVDDESMYNRLESANHELNKSNFGNAKILVEEVYEDLLTLL